MSEKQTIEYIDNMNKKETKDKSYIKYNKRKETVFVIFIAVLCVSIINGFGGPLQTYQYSSVSPSTTLLTGMLLGSWIFMFIDKIGYNIYLWKK